MNWLHTYGSNIDYKDLNVILNDEKSQEVCLYRQREETPWSLISIMKVSKLLH